MRLGSFFAHHFLIVFVQLGGGDTAFLLFFQSGRYGCFHLVSFGLPLQHFLVILFIFLLIKTEFFFYECLSFILFLPSFCFKGKDGCLTS